MGRRDNDKAKSRKICRRNKVRYNKVTLVELYNWKEKIKVINSKYKVKVSNIFMGDNLMREKRKRQREIRRMEEINRSKRHEVRVGYRRWKYIEREEYGDSKNIVRCSKRRKE